MERASEISNARINAKSGLHTILCDGEGRIRAIRSGGRGKTSGERGQAASRAGAIDARGGLVLPSFIDPHLHLDLAYTDALVAENKSGTLLEAIARWSKYKRGIKPRDVTERAGRAIEAEIGFGTGRIRTHVDVATAAGLRLCEGVLAAREKYRDRIDIQVAAFPQDGILQDPGALEQMRAAMRMGCDVVGGIAHNERTPQDSRRHLELLFDVAEEFDAPIDCHIDETDDPMSMCTEQFAALAIERRWHGRVTASHVCALSSYDEAHARKVINLIRAAEMTVVTNPGVNLHLQGRFDRYPKRRGLTRVKQLLSEGVPVAAGQDCIRDPFYPLGTGQMLEQAHLLVHADHLSLPAEMQWALAAITDHAARVMGVPQRDYGVRVGAFADLVVLPAPDVHEAIRTRPRPVCVLKCGRIVHKNPRG